MGDLLNYESDNPSIVELLDHGIHFSHHLLNHFNIQKGEYFPVIIQSEAPLVHMLKWGIENPIMAKGPGLTYIFGPTVEKQESLRKLMKYQRVLIPVNKFIHRRLGEGNDIVIKHPKNKVLWMAGLWNESSEGEKGFALLTCNTIEAKRNQIRRIPIFLTHKALINQWLNRNFTSIQEINKIMSIKSSPMVATGSMDLVEL